MRTVIIIAGLILLFAGCSKDTTPKTNLHGAMFLNKGWVTEFNYPNGEENYYNEYMMCFFWKNSFGYTFDAGNVRYGDSTLKDTGGLVYATFINNLRNGFTSAADPGKTWTVTGNEASQLPALTIKAPENFPPLLSTNYSSPPVIDRTAGYTFSLDNSAPCDSIEIRINGSVVVTTGMIAGNIASYTFTASQLSVLAASPTYTVPGLPITHESLSIHALVVNNQTISGMPLELYNVFDRQVRVIIK